MDCETRPHQGRGGEGTPLACARARRAARGGRPGAHRDDLHAGHDGRGGVGAVRRHGDDAHVAVLVAVGPAPRDTGTHAGREEHHRQERAALAARAPTAPARAPSRRTRPSTCAWADASPRAVRKGRLSASPRLAPPWHPRSQVVGADGHEAGVLAAGARVGLQAHGVKARDAAQLHGQVAEHLVVTLRLVLRDARATHAHDTARRSRPPRAASAPPPPANARPPDLGAKRGAPGARPPRCPAGRGAARDSPRGRRGGGWRARAT